MSILTLNTDPLAIDLAFEDSKFRVMLDDGRELSVPIDWFPRLRKATVAQRNNWRLIGRGVGIHWPDVDEDISVLGLIAGYADQTKRTAAE